MPDLVRDLVALAGIGLIAGGSYLMAGTAVAMIVTGLQLVALAIAGAWRRSLAPRQASDGPAGTG